MEQTKAKKPRLSFWQIWNMSFGFLGIQFGWGLQMGNMSAIYEYLGAEPDKIPLLWLAAPLTGLLVQPIIGYLSDRTWTGLGRRKPYFLTGAILASLALVSMPYSSTIWMAAGLLWVLDASINISMEPFRAFVADMLPDEQHARGFTMQSFFIGLGAVLAAVLPWLLINKLGYEKTSATGTIPQYVKISFFVGAIAFISSVLYTVISVKEYPPEDIDAFNKKKKETAGIGKGITEILHNITHMPKVMKQLALVQFFTWPGLFLMWFYLSVAIARNVFGAQKAGTELYADGIAWGNLMFGFYSLVTFVFALFLNKIADAIGKKHTHFLCLLLGGIGLISIGFIHDKWTLLLSMTGVGIAWTSILSMPYAMLAPNLPKEKMGVFMGIFNFFIVIPEIIASLGFGWIMSHLLDNNRLTAVMIGGGLLICAALLTLLVDDKSEKS